MDARVDLETETAGRSGFAPMKGARDRKEALAILALCLLTAAQTVVVVLLCIDVIRAAVG